MIQTALEIAPAASARLRRRQIQLLRELAEHLQQNRARLLTEWSRRIDAADSPTAMSKHDILEKTAAVYDEYVAAVAAGHVETLRSYFAHQLPSDLIESGVDAREIFRLTALLDDMLAGNALDRSLFAKFRHVQTQA